MSTGNNNLTGVNMFASTTARVDNFQQQESAMMDKFSVNVNLLSSTQQQAQWGALLQQQQHNLMASYQACKDSMGVGLPVPTVPNSIQQQQYQLLEQQQQLQQLQLQQQNLTQALNSALIMNATRSQSQGSDSIPITKHLVNLDNVKIPRRKNEGTKRVFDRPELKDWIDNRMMTFDDSVQVSQPVAVEEQGPSRTVIVAGRVREIISPPPQASSSFPTTPMYNECVPAMSNDQYSLPMSPSMDRPYSRSSSRRDYPRRSSSSFRGKRSRWSSSSSAHSNDWNEEEFFEPRRFVRGRSYPREQGEVEANDGRRKRSSKPSRILHITWLNDEGLPTLPEEQNQQMNRVLFNYFNNLAKTAGLLDVQRRAHRPFYTWLIYSSTKDAQLALKYIERQVMAGRKFLFKDVDTTFELLYKVDFSWKRSWNPHRKFY